MSLDSINLLFSDAWNSIMDWIYKTSSNLLKRTKSSPNLTYFWFKKTNTKNENIRS